VRPSVLARLRDLALVLLLALIVAASACAGTQKPKGPPAELRVIAEPVSASVQVDECFVGAARVLDKRPAKLSPGPKRITIEAPGYFPHDISVELPPGVTTLNIKLRPVPP